MIAFLCTLGVLCYLAMGSVALMVMETAMVVEQGDAYAGTSKAEAFWFVLGWPIPFLVNLSAFMMHKFDGDDIDE